MTTNHLAGAAGFNDPDPYDWRLFLKTVAAFALLLLVVDLLL